MYILNVQQKLNAVVEFLFYPNVLTSTKQNSQWKWCVQPGAIYELGGPCCT